MKLVSSLLSLTLFFCLHAEDTEKKEPISTLSAQDIMGHADFWVNNLPKLTQKEISLLANYLYFDFLFTLYELQARRALISFPTQFYAMNVQLLQNEAEARKISLGLSAQFKQLSQEFLPLRLYANKSLQAAGKTIENSDYKTLKELILNNRNYTQAIVAQFIKQDKAAIDKLITQEHQSLITHLEKLNSYKDTMEAILDSKNPYLKEGMDPDVANLEVALSLADATLGCINEITTPSILVKAMSLDMLSIVLMISRSFYNALYLSLTQSQKEKLTIMFDQNGLIDSSQQDELLELLDESFTVSKKHYLN